MASTARPRAPPTGAVAFTRPEARPIFDATRADGVGLTVQLRPHEDALVARVARKKLTVEPGEATDPDVTMSGDPRMFASVVYAGRPLADAVDAGYLVVEGDQSAAELFLSLYTLPPTVGDVA